LRRFLFAEWDEGTIEGLGARGYRIEEGSVEVPESPGFGLHLDDQRFDHAVANGGFSLTAR
uniref:hypothetical protein n=1 Tax=Vibrio cholerae TaxID=666 RepID=UPI001C1200C3